MNASEIISSNLAKWMKDNPSLDTLKKVAAKAGVGYGTVRRAKNGDGNTTIENLESIAAAFKKRPEDLLRLDYDPAKVTPIFAMREPDPLPGRLQELLDLARQINDQGQTELVGQARMLAHLYPRAKANHAN